MREYINIKDIIHKGRMLTKKQRELCKFITCKTIHIIYMLSHILF